MPGKKKYDYDPEPFKKLLQQLLNETGESHREASLASGLHPTTLSNYMRGARPMRDACIALADHFGINPNDLLELVGYEPMATFEKHPATPRDISNEVSRVASRIDQITDPETRKRLIQAVNLILDSYLLDYEASSEAKAQSGLERSKPKDTPA